MAKNNTEEQNNSEYIKLDEATYVKQETGNLSRCLGDTYSQQTLNDLNTEFGQNGNTILRHQSLQSSLPLCQAQSPSTCSSISVTPLVSNQVYQEYTSNIQRPDKLSQKINSQLHRSVMQDQSMSNAINYTITSPAHTESKPIVTIPQVNFQTQDTGNDPSKKSSLNSSYSQVTAAEELNTKVCLSDTTNTPKSNDIVATVGSSPYTEPFELQKSSSSGFRVAEFVLKHLGSVPGEERFYNWSNKTKDFVNNNLSKEIREKFYSNIASSSNSHSDKPTSDIMIDNEQQRNKRPRSKIESVIGSSDNKPENSKKVRKGKGMKYDNWIAERDHILKKYSNKLMRKKPMSCQSQEEVTDGLSSDT